MKPPTIGLLMTCIPNEFTCGNPHSNEEDLIYYSNQIVSKTSLK